MGTWADTWRHKTQGKKQDSRHMRKKGRRKKDRLEALHNDTSNYE